MGMAPLDGGAGKGTVFPAAVSECHKGLSAVLAEERGSMASLSHESADRTRGKAHWSTPTVWICDYLVLRYAAIR